MGKWVPLLGRSSSIKADSWENGAPLLNEGDIGGPLRTKVRRDANSISLMDPGNPIPLNEGIYLKLCRGLNMVYFLIKGYWVLWGKGVQDLREHAKAC